MFKLFFAAFFILSTYCYSQIAPEELDKLPPEIRKQLLEALQNANGQVEFNFNSEVQLEDSPKKDDEEKSDKKTVTPKINTLPKLTKSDKEKALKLIEELGANHFKIRKNAKKELVKMGFQTLTLLKEKLGKTDDPEVSENIKEIIAALTHRLHFDQLNEKQKAIAKLKFKQGTVSGPKAPGEFYNNNGHFIIDIGTTRMAFEGEVKQSTYSRTVNITLDGNSGGGGSSSSNGFKIYDYSYQNGVGYWTICGHSFTVSNYELEVKKEKLNLRPNNPQIIYFDKSGKPIGILDLK